jgi:hypothetical protein
MSYDQPSRAQWVMQCEQAGLNLDHLEADEVFKACQRLQGLLSTLDNMADAQSEAAAVFLPEEYLT